MVTAVPLGGAARELVELGRDFEEGARLFRRADVVLALVGVDVPVVTPREG